MLTFLALSVTLTVLTTLFLNLFSMTPLTSLHSAFFLPVWTHPSVSSRLFFGHSVADPTVFFPCHFLIRTRFCFGILPPLCGGAFPRHWVQSSEMIPDRSKPLVLKVWSQDQQHQPYLGIHQKFKFSDVTAGQLNWMKPPGVEPGNYALTSPPADPNACANLRTTGPSQSWWVVFPPSQ